MDLEKLRSGCARCSLQELCLPASIGDDDLHRLDAIVRSRRPLAPGDRLYRAGQPLASLYVAREGAFKTVADGADGTSQVIGFHLRPARGVAGDGFERAFARDVERGQRLARAIQPIAGRERPAGADDRVEPVQVVVADRRRQAQLLQRAARAAAAQLVEVEGDDGIHSAVQRFSQSLTVSCQSTLSCGFRIQWFSFGKRSSRLGTPRRCAAENAARPCSSSTR